MTSSNFLIGPVKDGLRKDVKPYAIPEDAFEVLTNAYQWRGRIVRRPGYTQLGELPSTATLTFTLVSGVGTISPVPIEPGTINLVGSSDGTTYTDPGLNGVLLATGGTGTGGTVNYITGAITVTPAVSETLTGTISFILPVMGLRTRELFGIDVQQLIAFDTFQSYSYTSGSFILLSSVMPVFWSGLNYQFFWSINYAMAFWATNSKPGLNGVAISNAVAGSMITTITTSDANTFVTGQTVTFIDINGPSGTFDLNGNSYLITVLTSTTFTIPYATISSYSNGGLALNSQVAIPGQDGIRYYANCTTLPGTAVGNTWVNYNPPIDPYTALAGALLIFAYRGYLVFLNTWEGNETGVNNFPNRARWSAIGTPFYASPVPNTPNLQTVNPNCMRDDLFGQGGANDAPTNEVIVGAAFIRDILVVYFERSTWRLRFVNNAQNPFVWERINVDYGSDCTFGCVPFDRGLMTIGDRGIVISDGNDTMRVDEKIPDDVFNIRQENQGFQRVFGIRTFRTRLVYWTYPSLDNPLGTFPDKVLIFNYDTKNWSYFDDSFTCFGYFYPSGDALTWAEMTENWNTYGNITWDSGTQSQGFETIVAGNQQGFVLLMEQTQGENGNSLLIDNIVGALVTSINHNLKDQQWITLTGVTGVTYSDGVTSLNDRNFKISNPANDPNTFSLNEFKGASAGNAIGILFTYEIAYVPIIPGSVEVTVGALTFLDTNLDGILQSSGSNSGTVDYNTGIIILNFSPTISSTPVYVRVVSYNQSQTIDPIATTGTYTGGGEIAIISNFDIQTKIFNFFGDDKRSRLSKIDFYTAASTTNNGQFTCNVFADSSNSIVNTPLSDNLQSNIVLTSPNPYQFGTNADQTIFRLFCDAIAQTIQLQLTMSDQQLAVSSINTSNFELVSMIVNLRRGGRLS